MTERAQTTSRCLETISKRDLKRLAALAQESRDDFFRLNEEWAERYQHRFLCSALGGEAAAHFLNGISGFARFEVWWFFKANPEVAFPTHRKSREDFGISHFGEDPSLPETFRGRAVDVQGRSVEVDDGDDPLPALQKYLRARATPTARELSRQALVVLEPEVLLGYEAWPTLVIK